MTDQTAERLAYETALATNGRASSEPRMAAAGSSHAVLFTRPRGQHTVQSMVGLHPPPAVVTKCLDCGLSGANLDEVVSLHAGRSTHTIRCALIPLAPLDDEHGQPVVLLGWPLYAAVWTTGL